MSDLLEIRDLLQDTSATMEQLERAMAASPDDWTLAETARSLHIRQKTLEAAFAEVADRSLVDICSYRLLAAPGERYPIAALSNSLNSFQIWLTATFDALKNGPKKRFRVPPDIVQQTELDFGYAYSGSLGFLFTIPNERLLFAESDLDRSIDVMFKMVRVQTSDDLRRLAKDYGIAVVSKMRDWLATNADRSLSVDIKWKRKDTIRNEVLVQPQEAKKVYDIITETSESSEEQLTIRGVLAGGDIETKTFHMKVPDADDISGRMATQFRYSGELTLGRSYSTTLIKRTLLHYATGQEDVSWELTALG